MVVLNTTDVIYFWPFVDFMALFRLFRGGEFKKPRSIIRQIIRVRSGGGETRFPIGEVFVYRIVRSKKTNKTRFGCTTNIYWSKLPYKTDFTYGDCCF